MLITSLVTGGAGFIGSHVVDELIEMGHQVVVLDDLSGGFKTNINPKAKFICGSILDHELVNSIFQEFQFDYIYHLAAYAAEGLSYFIKRFNYNNNLIGSINLINAAVNSNSVKCFVFTSSIAVYGTNQVPMTEDLIPSPEDPYGIAKLAVELDLQESFKLFGVPYIIFRPHNVYGERQNIGDKYRNVLGIFMNQILKNEELTVFGNGEQTRAFSYIQDVAPIIARSVEYPNSYGETFNIGADRHYSINEMITVISQVMGVSPKVKYTEARKEVVDAYASHQKVKDYFGDLIQNISLETGIQKMAAWVVKHGARESQHFSQIEVRKNMPTSWL